MTNRNATPSLRPQFWETVDLTNMTKSEWESLCDGCGKCCLLKLEDEDTEEIKFTNVACRLFDDTTCKCQNYALRKQMVAGCVVLTPENIERIAYWMPKTCGYRRVFEGQPLMDWHPLISGNPDSANITNNSFQNRTIPEYEVNEEDLENYIIQDEI
ncbi:MAG: YcgN family cysteine cluster protein [Amylibacter sp.]|jgi:uncharacterized cysteine cluster protein YcgN (CxxCxxCC family)|tara:strand:+ start:28624 stop:29094 length:471 start_codon:yes stop_codon:yes gene_type:complete